MDSRHVWCLACCAFLLAGLLGFGGPVTSLTISADDFGKGESIPVHHAYHDKNAPPILRIGNVPANARSLVLIVDDPDAPAGVWTHWLLWNLPSDSNAIIEDPLYPGARVGKNSFGHVRYDGPAPPSGTHRYFFRLYALDARLSLAMGSGRAALEEAMKGHVVGTGETFGVYAAQ